MFGEKSLFELVFLAAVALIVVGPKDLPVLMRRIGQFTAKMRGLAAEFRSSFEEMARQSELDELRKEVEDLRTGQIAVANHQAEIEQHFDELSHSLHPAPAYDHDGYDTASYEPPPAVKVEEVDEQPELFPEAVGARAEMAPLASEPAPFEAPLAHDIANDAPVQKASA